MALPKANRVTHKRDFDLIFRYGNAIKGNFLLVKHRKNLKPESRFGFTIASKVVKKAVDRNRVRRVLSESIRSNISKIAKGQDVIVSLKKRGEIEDLMAELADMFKKIK